MLERYWLVFTAIIFLIFSGIASYISAIENSVVEHSQVDLVIENKTYYLEKDLEIYGKLIVINSTIISNTSGRRIVVYGNALFMDSVLDGTNGRFSVIIKGNLTSVRTHFKMIGWNMGENEGVRVENGTVIVQNSYFFRGLRGLSIYNSSFVRVTESEFVLCDIGISSWNSYVEIDRIKFDGQILSGLALRFLNSKGSVDRAIIFRSAAAVLSWRSDLILSNFTATDNGNGIIILEGKVNIKNSLCGRNIWSNVHVGRRGKFYLNESRLHSSIAGIHVVGGSGYVFNSSIYNCGVGIFNSDSSYSYIYNSSIVGCGYAIDSYDRCIGERVYLLPKSSRGSFTILNESQTPLHVNLVEYYGVTLSGTIIVENITILKDSRIVNGNIVFDSELGNNVIILFGNSSVENTTFSYFTHSVHLLDNFNLKNVRMRNQLGMFVHGRGSIENFSTERGILMGILGAMICEGDCISLKDSKIMGNALGMLIIDSKNISVRNSILTSNAFNLMLYKSKDIFLETSEFKNSLLGLGTYYSENVSVEECEFYNAITLASFQFTSYVVRNSIFYGGNSIGDMQILVGDAYVNDTVGIVAEYSKGRIENVHFMKLEKGISNYFSEININMCCFEDCLLGIRSNVESVVLNTTFVAVGICASGKIRVLNSYVFVPEDNPDYLFVDGAKIENPSATPPLMPEIVILEGNVTGRFTKTAIIRNVSKIYNAEFTNGVVVYDNAEFTGNLLGKNSVVVLSKSARVSIKNGIFKDLRGIFCHTNNISVEYVEFNGIFDLIFENISGACVKRVKSYSKISIQAKRSEIFILNSSFEAYFTCIADREATVNVVSSDYSWTGYRGNGVVYHSRWLTVNVVDPYGDPIESDVILKYDGIIKIYHANNGRTTVPAPYSKRFLWFESPINVYVTARNQYFTYPELELYMDSDKEIILKPISVEENLQPILVSILLILFIFSLKNKNIFAFTILLSPSIFELSFYTYDNDSFLSSRSMVLDFKPGDILLMGIGSMTPSIFSHAAVFYMKSPHNKELFYESDMFGAHGSYLDRFMTEKMLVNLRVRGVCPAMILHVLSYMNDRVGFAYNPVWITKTHSLDRQYCSEYAYLAYKEININLDPLDGIWGWSYGFGVAPASILLSENVEIVWWL